MSVEEICIRVLPIISGICFESFKGRTNNTKGVEKGTVQQYSGLDIAFVVGKLLLFFKDVFISFIFLLLSL